MTITEFENNIKGELGERKIASLLRRRVAEKYKIFHNLGIPCGDDIQQVDLIYVIKQAVFVIESKNWAGLIKGNVDDNNWYSILPGKRHSHYNPIKQNNNHIKFLRKIIDVKVPIYSLIVFPDSSDVSSINVDNRFVKIVQYSYLNEMIDVITNEVDYEMSNKKFEEVCIAIEPYNEIDPEISKRHIERIKSKYKDYNDSYSKNDVYETDSIDNTHKQAGCFISIVVILFILIFAFFSNIFISDHKDSNNNTYNKPTTYQTKAREEHKFVGWKENNGAWYYYSAEGTMVKNGCVQDSGKIYYMGTDGAMVKDELIQVGNDYFYFGYDGAMIANSWDPSGQYYFGIDGKLQIATKMQNDIFPTEGTLDHKFNIISHNYFNETYTKDGEYFSDKCRVSIIIPFFDQQIAEDVSLNNSIRNAVYDIASDIEEEFYSDRYIESFVLDQYTLFKVNEEVVSVKLIGKIDRIEKVSYIIEFNRQNEEYTYWSE